MASQVSADFFQSYILNNAVTIVESDLLVKLRALSPFLNVSGGKCYQILFLNCDYAVYIVNNNMKYLVELFIPYNDCLILYNTAVKEKIM